MFENFFTTKMSPEKKSLEKRFSEISGKEKKISKIAIIAITSLLIIGAVSVSVVLAEFDGNRQNEVEKQSEPMADVLLHYVEYDEAYVPNDTIATLEVKPIVSDFSDGNDAADDKAEEIIFTNPIKGEIKITTPFGEKENPVTGNKIYHNGVDIAVNEGDMVYSSIGGIVAKAEYDPSQGNVVVVENGEYSILFAHLSSFDVNSGDEVFAGQKIGKAGKTGMTTGPNLHLEIKVGENLIDPEEILINLVQDNK